MDRESAFSYRCNQCALCCHDKVITLSPYDVLRMARTSGVNTAEAVQRYTSRRGSLLRFTTESACIALEGTRCGVHRGRPLACRLYPLGIERSEAGETLVRLEPAEGSLGQFGESGSAGEFLDAQGIDDYLRALEKYRDLISVFRDRVVAITDFEKIEPRQFWRRAVAEALLEAGFDRNPIIDAIFDPDSHGCARDSIEETVAAHIAKLRDLADAELDGEKLAAAAVMLAVSLGYSPGEVIAG
jgi:Fe-S-cluster containining protein